MYGKFITEVKIKLEADPSKLYFRIKIVNKLPIWHCFAINASGRFKVVNTSCSDFKDVDNEKSKVNLLVKLGYYKTVTRGSKSYLPLRKQMPMDEDGKTLRMEYSDYYIDENKESVIPVSKFEERGLPRNSIYTHKLATTLMRPDGRTEFFKPSDCQQYIAVGLLFDLEKVHLHGQKFIWRSNSVSKARFWLGNIAQNYILSAMHEWGVNVSLSELQNELRAQAAESQPQAKWNEMLVGLSKSSIQGFFVQDQAPLARLAMVLEYVNAKRDYGIDVPLFNIDGENEPKLYHESEMFKDLGLLFHAFNNEDYSQLGLLDRVDARDALIENLKTFFKPLIDNDDHSNDIKLALDMIQLIGGEMREKAYIDRHWPQNDEEYEETTVSKLLARECALSHPLLVKYIEQKKSYHASKPSSDVAPMEDDDYSAMPSKPSLM